jgi:hypothetical protein
VRTLKVRFANSTIADFSSQVAIALNTLFATTVTQQHANDNVIVLDGVYQRQGDTGTYVFTETRPTTLTANNDRVLDSVTITKAEFVTLVNPDDSSSTMQTVFRFWGKLAFKQMYVGDPNEPTATPYDVFSYDALVFSSLMINMSFPQSNPSGRTFAFDPSQMAFDAGASSVREHGLARHFPLTIKGMLSSSANKTPGDLGFMTVVTPLQATAVNAPWFALEYDLNLGTVGALAGDLGLIARLAVSWTPGSFGLPVSVGLKLPGSSSAKDEISIMGVVKITTYSMELLYTDGGYLLKLNGIALKFFGKALPPGGSFDFFVFGDPDPRAGSNSLGWYGAYIKDPPADKGKGDGGNSGELDGTGLRALHPARSR